MSFRPNYPLDDTRWQADTFMGFDRDLGHGRIQCNRVPKRGRNAATLFSQDLGSNPGMRIFRSFSDLAGFCRGGSRPGAARTRNAMDRMQMCGNFLRT